MIEKNKIYQHSYGNKLFINLGDDIDLNEYNNIKIFVKKPNIFICPYQESESEEICIECKEEFADCDGYTRIEIWEETSIKEEENNTIEYIFKEGNLNQYGRYYIQVELSNENIKVYSDTILLEVYRKFK